MKKKFLLAVLPLLLALPALASCHEGNGLPNFVVPENFDTSKQFELTFWAKNDTNKYQVAVYNKAVSDFEVLYPNIKVEIKAYTDYARIYQDVITNIPTNTTPNICITYPDHIATYLTGPNAMAPLDEVMENNKYGFGGSELKFDSIKENELIDRFMDEGVLNGKQYALPFMRSSEALYINKNFVEKLGYSIPDVVTWDWIYEVSDKALEKNEEGIYKVNGQNTMIPFIYKSTDNMMISTLKQKGYAYSNAEGDILLFKQENKANVKSLLEPIKEQAKLGAFSTFAISGYPANFLNKGQCIFAIDSTAGSTWMGSKAPLNDMSSDTHIEQFDTVVRTIPQFDMKNPQMISQGPSLCIFNKMDPQEVLASWLFAQYLLTNEVQISYSQTEGYIPVTKKAIESKKYQDYLSDRGEKENNYYVKIDATKLVIDNIDHTFVTPVFNGSASLRTAAGQLIESVVKNRKNNIDYDDLFDRMVSLYRLDQPAQGVELNTNLGPLPTGAIALFSVLGVTWAGVIVYFVIAKAKKRSKTKTKKSS